VLIFVSPLQYLKK